MLLWEVGEKGLLDDALARARVGRPTVLLIEGEAGTGKTSLLNTLVDRATDFRCLFADGLETVQQPFTVLEQWGVRSPDAGGAVHGSPLVAAQWLRAVVDAGSATGPVLLRLDDLHWGDPESVETITWLLRRAQGDRLLLAVGSRPLTSGQHSSWQRWAGSSPMVTRHRLAGLSQKMTAQLVRRRHPQAADESVRSLWVHTSGNPLYLTAVLNEHDLVDLQQMRVLPAPAEYARITEKRLGRLEPSTVKLVQAAAVTGGGWVDLPVLAAVAGVEDPSADAQRAAGSRLLDVRTVDGVLSTRITHALTRAAVYQGVPLALRRELHRSAAANVTDTYSALEHLVAAADQWDDELAERLEAYAVQMHNEDSYRLAAQFLRWSSKLTSEPAVRRRRHLDALFETALSPDRAPTGPDLDGFGSDVEPVRAALARGAHAVLGGDWSRGARILEPIAQLPLDHSDPLPRYRAEVLLAWARMGTNESDDVVLAGIERAQSLGVHDAAMALYADFAGGITAARATRPEQLLEQVKDLPANAHDFALEQTYLLNWRGDMRVFTGHWPEAIADLREAQTRISGGIDPTPGGFHSGGGVQAVLGYAHWFNGDWDRAHLFFRVAREVAEGSLLPIAAVYLTLHPSGVGDLAEADRQLEKITATLVDMPWQEAVQTLLIARVIRLHSGGDPTAQAALLGDLRSRWPRTSLDTGLVSATHFLHAALAAVWAEEIDFAQFCLEQMTRPAGSAPWVAAAATWVRSLLAEQEGRINDALHHVRRATDLQPLSMPFYRAHALADRARVAESIGNTHEAAASRQAALAIYSRLGAGAYVTRLSRTVETPAFVGQSSLIRSGLTDRERDVADLLASGLSYAQIARDLFITQSTVGYHVSKIYAKTGVRSRHELTELVRTPA